MHGSYVKGGARVKLKVWILRRTLVPESVMNVEWRMFQLIQSGLLNRGGGK